jgi:hypothetical protein
MVRVTVVLPPVMMPAALSATALGAGQVRSGHTDVRQHAGRITQGFRVLPRGGAGREEGTQAILEWMIAVDKGKWREDTDEADWQKDYDGHD